MTYQTEWSFRWDCLPTTAWSTEKLKATMIISFISRTYVLWNLGQMIGACGSTVRHATSSVSKTNPSITIAWEVPSYNVCKTIHLLVSNFLKTSSGAYTSQKLPKKQTPSLASSVETCHIARQHVDRMLISLWYDQLLNMVPSSGIHSFSKI